MESQRKHVACAVVGEAWWDEYAPLYVSPEAKQSLPDDSLESAVQQGPIAVMTLDPSWRRMGRIMIANARRRRRSVVAGLIACPVSTRQELHALRSERAHGLRTLACGQARRSAKAQGEENALVRGRAWGPLSIGIGAGEVEAFVATVYAGATDPESIRRFDEDNQSSLATPWRWMPIEALRLKQKSQRCRLNLLAKLGPHAAGAFKLAS
ncbi:MAG: hypothetical protein R3C31_10225 [Hyphomonadaceae bacterium]